MCIRDRVNSVMNGETYTWIDDKVEAGVTVLDSETGKVLAIGAGRNRGSGDWNLSLIHIFFFYLTHYHLFSFFFTKS